MSRRLEVGRARVGAMRALGLAVVLACATARAGPGPGDSPHRFTVYFTTGGAAYLSEARTFGGIGGGLGLRDTVGQYLLLQADVSYLMMVGNAGVLRVGAGLQRPGVYAPAALFTLSCFWGERLSFLTPQHPEPVAGPAVAAGLLLAPLRFVHDRTGVSLFQLNVGVGSDLPGAGLGLRVDVAEVGISF
ncbi:hypothetical protein BO221_26530 [Archangium sp. Cb G35]|uniref:hypothetical protein n=1 Tax=Archangium sp. Cb G35 TaxID=1920190 RepID=UPI000937891F|nr:hypothetical protein [Archangium sp. Cb G35]OJT21381.1 hypothetical protein BO221_26530 [Archangium sp. Cb G35]